MKKFSWKNEVFRNVLIRKEIKIILPTLSFDWSSVGNSWKFFLPKHLGQILENHQIFKVRLYISIFKFHHWYELLILNLSLFLSIIASEVMIKTEQIKIIPFSGKMCPKQWKTTKTLRLCYHFFSKWNYIVHTLMHPKILLLTISMHRRHNHYPKAQSKHVSLMQIAKPIISIDNLHPVLKIRTSLIISYLEPLNLESKNKQSQPFTYSQIRTLDSMLRIKVFSKPKSDQQPSHIWTVLESGQQFQSIEVFFSKKKITNQMRNANPMFHSLKTQESGSIFQ